MKIKLIRYSKTESVINRKNNEERQPRESDKAAQVEWEIKLQSDGLFIQTENNFYHIADE